MLPPERVLPMELSPAELEALKGADKAVAGEPLPPIFVRVETGYYEQVAYEVPVSYPARRLEHRRRSLQARGAHNFAAPAESGPRTRTLYRSVWRPSARKIDITPIINKYAQKYNLDPWLLRGVIEVESAFRPYATSCAGAGGLMQLMPGTASYLGCRDRFDPDQNIAAGARYLRMMLNRFGEYELAIAAYNAGPGNVERYGGIPPFAETRNYVKKVVRAWNWRPANS